MILLFVTVMGGMASASLIYEGLVSSDRYGCEGQRSFWPAIMSWVLGVLTTVGLSVLGGWVLGGFSDDYWLHTAQSNAKWGLGIGFIVCAGGISIIRDQRNG